MGTGGLDTGACTEGLAPPRVVGQLGSDPCLSSVVSPLAKGKDRSRPLSGSTTGRGLKEVWPAEGAAGPPGPLCLDWPLQQAVSYPAAWKLPEVWCIGPWPQPSPVLAWL